MKIIKNYYDIVILPPPEINQYCIELSQKIKSRYGVKFAFGKTQYHPHISLLHTAFSDKNLRLLKKRLAIIATETKPFKIQIKQFFNSPSSGSVTLQADSKTSFLPLYEKVITLTKDLIYRDFDYFSV